MTKEETLTQVIRQANPGIKVMVKCGFCDGSIPASFEEICEQCEGSGEIGVYRPIRLADVLLALNDKEFAGLYLISSAGVFGKFQAQGARQPIEVLYATWNLRDDNLDHQSEECKQFLIDLLVTLPFEEDNKKPITDEDNTNT
jgi:hypothetical protein